MNTRIAALFFIIAFSEEGMAEDHFTGNEWQTPDTNPGFQVPKTQKEWERLYVKGDPKFAAQQRQSAGNSTDTDGTESNHPSLVHLVARSKPADVMLEVDASDGHQYAGTGFFISSDGYLVTAAHLISRARGLVAIANDGTQYYATRTAYLDKDADLAILKFDCRDVAFLEPDITEAEEGQSIIVIGSPECLAGTVSTGIVSAVREDEIQISAPISHGSSGSPVMNEYGLVVGVARSGLKDGQNLNFAVPLVEIWRAMEAVNGLKARRWEILDQYRAK